MRMCKAKKRDMLQKVDVDRQMDGLLMDRNHRKMIWSRLFKNNKNIAKICFCLLKDILTESLVIVTVFS